jgi:hypothetical protein
MLRAAQVQPGSLRLVPQGRSQVPRVISVPKELLKQDLIYKVALGVLKHKVMSAAPQEMLRAAQVQPGSLRLVPQGRSQVPRVISVPKELLKQDLIYKVALGVLEHKGMLVVLQRTLQPLQLPLMPMEMVCTLRDPRKLKKWKNTEKKLNSVERRMTF